MKSLKNYLNQNGLFAPEILEKFRLFYNTLKEANETVNLTAVTDEAEAEQKHFIDSLSATPYLYGSGVDIGAGAGFPSLPLAIVKPQINFTLVDSVGKKVLFLERMRGLLELENITVIKSRVEDLDKTKRYDFALSRGVGALNILCEYCLPFVKKGGLLIAYKAQKAEEEILAAKNALKILGGEVETIIPYRLTINGETHERNLVLIRKSGDTDKKYPRGQNKPRLQPL